MENRAEYQIWSGIKQRCHNPKNAYYAIYGAKGVKMYGPWRESFATFLAHMGPRPSPKHSVDRIDNEQGYIPGNCRWATTTEQSRNRRPRTTNVFGLAGVSRCGKTGKLIVGIGVNGKQKRIGQAEDIFEAACLRKSAENFYWGERATAALASGIARLTTPVHPVSGKPLPKKQTRDLQATHYTSSDQRLAFSKMLTDNERMLNVRDRRKALAKHEAVELIAEYGQARAERLLKAHRTTVERWATGEIVPSEAVLIALRAACKGRLPGMESRQWEGWSFGLDGSFYEPNGRPHSAGDIMAQQYERALIKALQVENADLRKRLTKALDDTNQAANDPLAARL